MAHIVNATARLLVWRDGTRLVPTEPLDVTDEKVAKMRECKSFQAWETLGWVKVAPTVGGPTAEPAPADDPAPRGWVSAPEPKPKRKYTRRKKAAEPPAEPVAEATADTED